MAWEVVASSRAWGSATFRNSAIRSSAMRRRRSVLRLRRMALERMALFRNVALPARKLATTSQAIHEHDLAVRHLREALVAFHHITPVLAIGESEPAVPLS